MYDLLTPVRSYHHDTWKAALAASFNASGVNYKGNFVSADMVKTMNAQMNCLARPARRPAPLTAPFFNDVSARK